MKAFKTIISIVFIVGTVAIIYFDGKTKAQKNSEPLHAKTDSASHVNHKN